jgi:hypothetical protein
VIDNHLMDGSTSKALVNTDAFINTLFISGTTNRVDLPLFFKGWH